MGDAALSSAEESIAVKTPLDDASDRLVSQSLFESAEVESLIPTAIVKPKYQKLSFDERQLPVVDSSWQSPTNTASTTITSTPRKVQKHLPKSQKSFSKQQSRKLSSKSVDYDERDVDSGAIQNSIAIVQPLKKVIDCGVSASDEKSQKADSSKNSIAMSHKHEQKFRQSSKMIAANELASIMTECGKNNLSGATRKPASVCDVKKLSTKKRECRGEFDLQHARGFWLVG
jgi:hypothetical protein